MGLLRPWEPQQVLQRAAVLSPQSPGCHLLFKKMKNNYIVSCGKNQVCFALENLQSVNKTIKHVIGELSGNHPHRHSRGPHST